MSQSLVVLEEVVAEWEKELEWRETMEFCDRCTAWVNHHMAADIVRLCPKVNLCAYQMPELE
jgi:hypothetical protein